MMDKARQNPLLNVSDIYSHSGAVPPRIGIQAARRHACRPSFACFRSRSVSPERTIAVIKLHAAALEKHQPEDRILVLGSRDGAAELVGGVPKGGSEVVMGHACSPCGGVQDWRFMSQPSRREPKVQTYSSMKSISSPGWQPKYRQSLSMISVPMFAPG